MSKKKLNYTEALTELEGIIEQIESGDLTVDELSEKVKTAADLVKVCQDKLRKTEDDINKTLEGLE
ncbi:exodeoxyribonuclease VII small subunit [Fulvivirga sp.]|uniref:exodeoxyribonuclease VII small subunit n=1 Tax=Fulvivirga sp. TaxID=1931237 RepID=UPI0032ED4E13